MFRDELLTPVRRCSAHSGTFSLPQRITIQTAAPREDAQAVKTLGAELRSFRFTVPQRTPKSVPANITLIRDPKITGAEAYRLTVSPEGIEIRSSGAAGAYYAVQTLRQILRHHPRRIPCCRIDDAPSFARRGVYLDISRGRVPKLSTLKALVERLAAVQRGAPLEALLEQVLELNPDLAVGIQGPDQAFPHFILHEMKGGLAGLIIAAIFAAAMSSIDSMAPCNSTVGSGYAFYTLVIRAFGFFTLSEQGV